MGKRAIIVTGCGASGTKYTAKFFQTLGIGVPHEILGRDGIVSWYFAPGYRVIGSPFRSSPPLRKIKETTFGRYPYIVHQVRHPLNVISSIQNANPRSINFISDIMGIDFNEEGMLRFFMLYWIHWNRMVEKYSIARIRIENFKNDIENVLLLTGKNDSVQFIPKAMDLLDTNINSKKHGKKYIKRTWIDLLNEDKGLTGEIINLANRYGYNINKEKVMEGKCQS